MTALSQSYIRVMTLMKDKKTDEAAQEFRTGMAATVRKLYSEAASAYPQRYSGKIAEDAWSEWSAQLYQKTRKAEDALKKGDAEAAAKLLPELREHVYALHEKTQTRKANDYIYAFYRKAEGDKVQIADLASLAAELDKAQPSLKAKSEAEAYGKAKAEWSGKVEPILKDGKIQRGEQKELQNASEKFYEAFGIQFE